MQKLLRTRLVTALVLILVFVAGGVSGVAIGRGLQTGRRDSSRSADARRTPIYMKVNPTSRQQALIDSILRAQGPAYRKFHAEFRKALDQLRKTYDPRREALIKGTVAAIDSVLTPAQAARYDSLIAENNRKRAERGSSRQNRQ